MFTKSSPTISNEKFGSLWKVMSNEGLRYASKGFSDMVGATISIAAPEVRLAPLSDLPIIADDADPRVASIYVQIQGGLSGEIALILPHRKALELVDLILNEPPGTTQVLGDLERSALGELGNLTGSFFLNAVAAFAGIEARPSPPTVKVASFETVWAELATTVGGHDRPALILQVAFTNAYREAQANFWVIPTPAMLDQWQARPLH